jgi:hypothetical protein
MPEFPVFLTHRRKDQQVPAEPGRDLLMEWLEAFVREVGDPPGRDHGAATV